jgi:hypothetical protein
MYNHVSLDLVFNVCVCFHFDITKLDILKLCLKSSGIINWINNKMKTRYVNICPSIHLLGDT